MVSWKEAVKLFEAQDAEMTEAGKLLEDMARWFLHEKGE